MSDQNDQNPVELVAPGVPADQGLSTLGLLMQLGGSLFAAIAAIGTVTIVLSPSGRGDDKLWVLLVLGLCIARSLFHRGAGTELLYGRGGDPGASPLAGVKRYIVIGLAHAAVMFMILTGKFHVPFKVGFGVSLGLAAWPAVLAVLFMLPRFRRFSQALPVSEDKGFEAASVLMTILGVTGALCMGLFLVMMLSAGGALAQGPGVLVLLAGILLFIRSCLHVQAGVSGLGQTSIDRSVELANRYANFGIISTFCAGGAVLMLVMGVMAIPALAMVAGMCWTPMAWPLIVRRFYSDRQFSELMAGEQASTHRRAPDAGLTGLGWLLFAQAMMSLAMMIPLLVIDRHDLPRKMYDLSAMMARSGMHSVWWDAGLIALQAWAGYELIRMGRLHRVVATAFAVVAALVAIYVSWPMFQNMKLVLRMGPQGLASYLPLAIQLVLPVVTLILVNRTIAPSARARFRPAT